MNPAELAGVVAVGMERLLSDAATLPASEPDPDEPQPMTDAEQARLRRPSTRPDRDGAPWFSACEAAAKLGAVMHTAGTSFIPVDQSQIIQPANQEPGDG
ncbi:hypothetical protein AB0H76_15070 [Nocardia sp. NPDC050712]|uniref:hypothetical protein n=1 Tax=Nocardia sp. NPDC050712 TaxID=3155518 RepID=UPI00340004D9